MVLSHLVLFVIAASVTLPEVRKHLEESQSGLGFRLLLECLEEFGEFSTVFFQQLAHSHHCYLL